MNWKIYEWIVVQFFLEGEIYEWIGRYTTELGFRFFFGIIDVYFIFSIGGLGFWNPKIYELIGRYTMNWKICEWIGRYTNELWFRFFLKGKKRMNWKIYEWIGVHFFWKIYEWIGRYTSELWFRFFFGIYTNELEDIRMNWGLDFFFE